MIALFHETVEFTGRFLVGLGALGAGVGSVLSGLAALKKARDEGRKETQSEAA
jgi:hypothetical protein